MNDELILLDRPRRRLYMCHANDELKYGMIGGGS
jgi:hypothetical protein